MDLSNLKKELNAFLETKKYFLYDAELENVDGMTFLVIKIEDINLEEIVKLNEGINEIVDKTFDKFYKDPYFLEVTSAGINRELKTLDQELRQIDSNVIVETKNSKFVEGQLVESEEDYVLIASKDEDIRISRSKVIKMILNN